jgi:hypothetical protein
MIRTRTTATPGHMATTRGDHTMSVNEDLITAEAMSYFTRRQAELVRAKTAFLTSMSDEAATATAGQLEAWRVLVEECTTRIDENIIAVTALAAEEQQRRRKAYSPQA